MPRSPRTPSSTPAADGSAPAAPTTNREALSTSNRISMDGDYIIGTTSLGSTWINSRYIGETISFDTKTKAPEIKKLKPTHYICNTKGEAIVPLYKPLKESQLTNLDLTCADFRNQDLSGANLSNSYMKMADFRGANLENCYIEEGNLSSANFEGANLKGIKIISTSMQNVVLTLANLENAELRDIDLTRGLAVNTNFKRAKISDVNFGRTNLIGANFSRARLQQVDFIGTRLRETRMIKAKVKECWFDDIDGMIGLEIKNPTYECHLHSVNGPNTEGRYTYRVEVVDKGRSQVREIIGYTLRDAKRRAGIL